MYMKSSASLLYLSYFHLFKFCVFLLKFPVVSNNSKDLVNTSQSCPNMF